MQGRKAAGCFKSNIFATQSAHKPFGTYQPWPLQITIGSLRHIEHGFRFVEGVECERLFAFAITDRANAGQRHTKFCLGGCDDIASCGAER
jgi:hypothetical protein